MAEENAENSGRQCAEAAETEHCGAFGTVWVDIDSLRMIKHRLTRCCVTADTIVKHRRTAHITNMEHLSTTPILTAQPSPTLNTVDEELALASSAELAVLIPLRTYIHICITRERACTRTCIPNYPILDSLERG